MIAKKDSNSEYHSHPAVSSSTFKEIYLKSVYHAVNKSWKATDAMNLGTAVHTMILEPEEFNDQIYVLPKIDRRTKAGKEEYQRCLFKSQGKVMITPDQMDIVKAVTHNALGDDKVLDLLKGEREISFYSEIDGVPIKARPDVYNESNGMIADVKTCQNNEPRAFRSEIKKRAYHLQAVFYCRVLNIDPLNWRFIALETNTPYTCQVYALSNEHIEEGEKAFDRVFNDWKFYLDTGIAAGYNGYDTTADGAIIL